MATTYTLTNPVETMQRVLVLGLIVLIAWMSGSLGVSV